MSLEIAPEPISNPSLYYDVLTGLRRDPPTIPAKYLYDERGSRLFEEICDLPEYYLTDREWKLTRKYASDLAALIGSKPQLIELGSGSGKKTQLLLHHLHGVTAYTPVDISRTALTQCVDNLSSRFPDLKIAPIHTDYTADFELPRNHGQGRSVLYFPGSTIGNFVVEEACNFLSHLAEMAEPRTALIIGADLRKDRSIIEAAYNDSRGVTAAFNRNLLRRINRECNATFDVEAFRHRAVYDEERHRIEMRLVSLRDHSVSLPADQHFFEEGEFIITEYSHKYSVEQFINLAESAGWRTRALWTDEDQYFSLWLFEIADSNGGVS